MHTPPHRQDPHGSSLERRMRDERPRAGQVEQPRSQSSWAALPEVPETSRRPRPLGSWPLPSDGSPSQGSAVAGVPQTNGTAERFIKTCLEGWEEPTAGDPAIWESTRGGLHGPRWPQPSSVAPSAADRCM